MAIPMRKVITKKRIRLSLKGLWKIAATAPTNHAEDKAVHKFLEYVESQMKPTKLQ